MTKKHQTKEPTVQDTIDFMEELKELFALNDRAATLSIYALLKHDPGEQYTEAEIRQAIKYLKDNDRDAHTPIAESAVKWLLKSTPSAERETA